MNPRLSGVLTTRAHIAAGGVLLMAFMDPVAPRRFLRSGSSFNLLLKNLSRTYGTTVDNVLDLLDQLTFDAERATGVTGIPHPFWVYNRPVDIDGLRKFQHHLQQGWLPRRIEPSPLRFGRHRWVSADRPSEIEIVAASRPRA